jgi:hypothetical protein
LYKDILPFPATRRQQAIIQGVSAVFSGGGTVTSSGDISACTVTKIADRALYVASATDETKSCRLLPEQRTVERVR